MSCLDAFVTAYNQLTAAIEAHNDCCADIVNAINNLELGGGTTVVDVTIPPGSDELVGVDETTYPPETVDIDTPTIPSGFPGVPEYQAYLCALAHKLASTTDEAVDRIAATIRFTSNITTFFILLVLAFGNIFGMAIAAVLVGGYSLLSVGEIFGAFSAFTELREAILGDDPSGTIGTTKAELNAAYDDLVEAITCASTADEASSNLHDVFDANVSTLTFRTILKVWFSVPVMRWLWSEPAPLTPRADCPCIESGTFYDLDALFTWDVDAQGWKTSSGCRTSSGSSVLWDSATQSYRAWGNTVGNSCGISVGGSVVATVAGQPTSGSLTLEYFAVDLWRPTGSTPDITKTYRISAAGVELEEDLVVNLPEGQANAIRRVFTAEDLAGLSAQSLSTNTNAVVGFGIDGSSPPVHIDNLRIAGSVAA